MLDRVVHRGNIRDELVTIARLLMNQEEAIKGELTSEQKPEPAQA